MSTSEPAEALVWPIRSSAEAIHVSLMTIISILDGVDPTFTHTALRNARDKLDLEKAKYHALVVQINNGKMGDEDVGEKLEEAKNDFSLSKISIPSKWHLPTLREP